MQLYLGAARKQHRSMLKGSKQTHEVLRFLSRRETPRSHVLNFRATSGHNVLYMRSDVSKEMSRFRLPSSGRRRLLIKVPNDCPETHSIFSQPCRQKQNQSLIFCTSFSASQQLHVFAIGNRQTDRRTHQQTHMQKITFFSLMPSTPTSIVNRRVRKQQPH